jgi:hypothetical protein
MSAGHFLEEARRTVGVDEKDIKNRRGNAFSIAAINHLYKDSPGK